MGTMGREKADIGVLICMDMPAKAMRDEMTIAEMFPDIANGRAAWRIDPPWARTDTVKKAAAKGDADKQGSLL